MEYWKNGELHGRRRHINQGGRKTRNNHQKLDPEAEILPA